MFPGETVRSYSQQLYGYRGQDEVLIASLHSEMCNERRARTPR